MRSKLLQLGRMMAYKAHQMGIQLTCLDPKGPESPAGQVVSCLTGSFNDSVAIDLLSKCESFSISTYSTRLNHLYISLQLVM